MAAVSATAPRAFAVWWKDLERWSPGSARRDTWRWPPSAIKKLADALERRNERVDKTTFELRPEHFVSLRFTGEVEQRALHGKEEFKGTLYFARAGDLVYSKIDARNGAFGIIPESIPVATVTSEFPVYRIKEAVALSEYIQLVFRSEHFKKRINTMVSGASGRKRVQPDELEQVEIPLPSLAEQKAIVAYWRKVQNPVEQALLDLGAASAELDAALHSVTNFHSLETPMLVLRWQDFGQWDVKNSRAAAFHIANPSFIPLAHYAEDATEMVKPWLEPEKEWPVYGVNNKEGVFFSHFQKGAEFNAPYKRIRKNWFFHNPTRSSVGSLGIVPDVPDDAITSPEYQVWRLRLGSEWTPEFVAALVRTTWFVKLIQVHRVGAVKQRLYVENLLSMPMPVVSSAIRHKAGKQRQAALKKLAEAQQSAKTANAEIEALILGTQSLNDADGAG